MAQVVHLTGIFICYSGCENALAAEVKDYLSEHDQEYTDITKLDQNAQNGNGREINYAALDCEADSEYDFDSKIKNTSLHKSPNDWTNLACSPPI